MTPSLHLHVCRTDLRLQRSRGMAVISALLVVAAASMIAASMLDRQTQQIRMLESETTRVQARALLQGGIDWARVILRADARRHATTRGDQIWATPISNMLVSQEDDDAAAVFSGRVEDELSKFNLQNLARDGQPDDQGIAALTRLMHSLNLEARVVAPIAQRMADAQARRADPPAQAEPAGGVKPAALVPAQAPGLHSVTGLRAFGVDDATITSLRPYLTVLPVRTPLNVNTASAEVIAATLADVSFAQASALVDQRDRGQYFNNPADFRNRLNAPDADIADVDLAVNSPWFSVTGTVRIGQANVEMQALLRREGDAIPAVLWIMETL